MGPLDPQQKLPVAPQKIEPKKANKVEDATFPEINDLQKLIFSSLSLDEREDLIKPEGKDRTYQLIVDQTISEKLTSLSKIIDSLVSQLDPPAKYEPQIKELRDIQKELKEKRPDQIADIHNFSDDIRVKLYGIINRLSPEEKESLKETEKLKSIISLANLYEICNDEVKFPPAILDEQKRLVQEAITHGDPLLAIQLAKGVDFRDLFVDHIFPQIVREGLLNKCLKFVKTNEPKLTENYIDFALQKIANEYLKQGHFEKASKIENDILNNHHKDEFYLALGLDMIKNNKDPSEIINKIQDDRNKHYFNSLKNGNLEEILVLHTNTYNLHDEFLLFAIERFEKNGKMDEALKLVPNIFNHTERFQISSHITNKLLEEGNIDEAIKFFGAMMNDNFQSDFILKLYNQGKEKEALTLASTKNSALEKLLNTVDIAKLADAICLYDNGMKYDFNLREGDTKQLFLQQLENKLIEKGDFIRASKIFKLREMVFSKDLVESFIKKAFESNISLEDLAQIVKNLNDDFVNEDIVEYLLNKGRIEDAFRLGSTVYHDDKTHMSNLLHEVAKKFLDIDDSKQINSIIEKYPSNPVITSFMKAHFLPENEAIKEIINLGQNLLKQEPKNINDLHFALLVMRKYKGKDDKLDKLFFSVRDDYWYPMFKMGEDKRMEMILKSAPKPPE